MQGILNRYLANDHDRLDALLRKAEGGGGEVDAEAYAAFRIGLLRHIGIEEKIVLPTIARLQNGQQAVVARRLRLDHGALTALLVPPPSRSIIRTIRSILGKHNALEEGNGGLYELLDRLAASEAEGLLQSFKTIPNVKTVPHNDKPEVLAATHRALARAGYKMLNED